MKSKKFITKFLSLLICFSFVLNTGVVSAKTKNVLTEEELNQRRAYIDENIRLLGAQGQDAIDEFFSKNNVVKLNAATDISNSDLSVQSYYGNVGLNATVWYDQYAGRYVVQGSWQWDNINSVDSSAGALDGVALTMYQTNYQPVTGFVYASNPANIQIYDQWGTPYTGLGGTGAISNSGIAWAFQDKWQNGSYAGYHGIVWFHLTQKPAQSTIYVGISYEHTWTTAVCNSYGISWVLDTLPVINMTFSIETQFIKPVNQITVTSWPRL